MSNTAISIEVKDLIGRHISKKLRMIGLSAASAAPGLTAFKTAWGGLNFAGMKGIGLGCKK